MRFCRECGAVLTLFEFTEDDICANCVPGQEELIDGESLLPSGVTLGANRDGVVTLSTAAGVVLWSGSALESQDLAMILRRAAKVYAIRSKQNSGRAL